jgi:putative Holliday junction resolvase
VAETGTGRVLGLDLGDARIGVAISDPERRLAVPVGTIHVGQPPGELKAVAALVAEHDATLLVIGLPRSMSGDEGPRAALAREFGGALEAAVRVPIEFQDERLSTVEAERVLREAGVTGRERRRVVDRSAATVILQAWLDAHR